VTHLHSVDDGGHSVRVPPADLSMEQITTLQHVAAVVLKSAAETTRELTAALERRDVAAVAVCCRKLASVGRLADMDRFTLERGL
jgi:hypothetical protein